MRFKLLMLFSVFFSFHSFVEAQTKLNYEVSINLGLASFQTDYGERHDFKSGVTGNVGLAAGASFYINFFNYDPKINPNPNWRQKHLKLKIETSYLKANLDHFGSYQAEDSQNGLKLRSMHGKTSVINLGTMIEYHPYNIPDFITTKKRWVAPYFGLGVMGGYSMPSVTTDLGDWQDEVNLIQAYHAYGSDDSTVQPIDIDSKLVLSLVFGAGLRFEIDFEAALMIDMRWQYFNNDYIDGLSPNPGIVPNKYNDWLYYLNVGYVFEFGENTRISTWLKRNKRAR